MTNPTNRLRYGPDELMRILQRELRGAADPATPPAGRPAVARPMVAGEVEVPCHPRERVPVGVGATEVACPDCGVPFPVGNDRQRG